MSGASNINTRWLLPLAVPALPLIVGLAAERSKRVAVAFSVLAVALGVLFTAGQWIESVYRNPRTNYDYSALQRAIASQTGARSVVITDYAVLANLRLYDPGLTIIDAVMPAAARMPLDRAVAIWLDDAGAVTDLVTRLGACPADDQVFTHTLVASAQHKQVLVSFRRIKRSCP